MQENVFPIYPGWETVRKIGTGSYGTVYEIERDILGKKEKSALKVISVPPSESDIEELYNSGFDEESINRRIKASLEDIVKEYQLMMEVKGHSNIVYCDDIRYEPKNTGMGWDVYIKMELLTSLLQSPESIRTERDVIKLGIDICNALCLCKKHNIIHRNIKPQNIFVSKDGVFKLGDFGIAKMIEQTTGGTKTGPASYMAPEIYNYEPYGHSVDVYSLGLVMYWLLNKRRMPFVTLPPDVPTANEIYEARKRRFSGERIPAPVYGTEMLKQIVLKACAFKPSDRFASADEMLARLNYLNTSPYSRK